MWYLPPRYTTPGLYTSSASKPVPCGLRIGLEAFRVNGPMAQSGRLPAVWSAAAGPAATTPIVVAVAARTRARINRVTRRGDERIGAPSGGGDAVIIDGAEKQRHGGLRQKSTDC